MRESREESLGGVETTMLFKADRMSSSTAFAEGEEVLLRLSIVKRGKYVDENKQNVSYDLEVSLISRLLF